MQIGEGKYKTQYRNMFLLVMDYLQIVYVLCLCIMALKQKLLKYISTMSEMFFIFNEFCLCLPE